jgi:predicted outer membrane repeat protein
MIIRTFSQTNCLLRFQLFIGIQVMLILALLLAFADSKCVGVYTATQLRAAIQSANHCSNSVSTLITLCSDFKLGSEATSHPYGVFDLSKRNIRLQCNKTQTGTTSAQRNPRCVFDAEYTTAWIFGGEQAKVSVFGANFVNAGNGMWEFFNSNIILQQCSFLHNTAQFGGAISVRGGKSKLTIRGGTRASQNLFYNNTAVKGGGAIYFSGQRFSIGGKSTNFTKNRGEINAGAVYAEVLYNQSDIIVSGASFFDNFAFANVRTCESLDVCDEIVILVSLCKHDHFLLLNSHTLFYDNSF